MDIMSFLTAIAGISAIIIATWKISGQIGGLQSQINGVQHQINGLQNQINGLQNQINNLATEVHGINEFLRREK